MLPVSEWYVRFPWAAWVGELARGYFPKGSCPVGLSGRAKDCDGVHGWDEMPECPSLRLGVLRSKQEKGHCSCHGFSPQNPTEPPTRERTSPGVSITFKESLPHIISVWDWVGFSSMNPLCRWPSPEVGVWGHGYLVGEGRTDRQVGSGPHFPSLTCRLQSLKPTWPEKQEKLLVEGRGWMEVLLSPWMALLFIKIKPLLRLKETGGVLIIHKWLCELRGLLEISHKSRESTVGSIFNGRAVGKKRSLLHPLSLPLPAHSI